MDLSNLLRDAFYFLFFRSIVSNFSIFCFQRWDVLTKASSIHARVCLLSNPGLWLVGSVFPFSPFGRCSLCFSSAPIVNFPLYSFPPLWFDFIVMYITPIYSLSLSWLMIPCYFMISVGAWPSDGRKCKVFKFFRNSNIRKYERECDFQSREEREETSLKEARWTFFHLFLDPTWIL